jgi:acyl-CoA synthetase (NDP forming)
VRHAEQALLTRPGSGGRPADTRGDLRALISPRSIAIVGASADQTKLSGLPLYFLRRHGYRGQVYPINPRAAEIDGLRCYPSLAAVGQPVDLAVILLPAERVLEAIDDCLAAGVGAAIVAASGFAEAGEQGRALQQALEQRIVGTPLRVLGPNCMGVVNLLEGVAASFSQSMFVERLVPGRLALLTQSGAIGGSIIDQCHSRGIGLSHWVSTGNQADLDVVECARYLLENPEVEALALYVEGLKDAGAYVSFLREARALGKSLLVLRSGQSADGARAVASHTGAMVGNAAVFSAVSRQYGAILVNDVEELVDCAAALLTRRKAIGPRVGVVSSSGGLAVLLADEAERRELCLPSFGEATLRALSSIAPSYASVANPVDLTANLVARLMGGESGLWRDCYLAVASDPNVDQVVVGLTMVTGEAGVALANEVIAAAERTDKPLVVIWIGADLCREAFTRLREAGVPVYPSVARGMRAARALVEWGSQRAEPAGLVGPLERRVAAAVATHRGDGRTPGAHNGSEFQLVAAAASLPVAGGVLTEWDCQALLRAAGVPTPCGELVRSPEDAAAAARRLASEVGTVVLKVQSPDVTHKTDLGAVRVGVHPADASPVYDELVANVARCRPRARVQGVLVQETVAGGLEVLVAVTRDPEFGPMLAFGLGGVLAEFHGQLALRHLPLRRDEVEELLRSARSARLLDGHRGRPPSDHRALADTVVRVATLAEVVGDRLLEFEMNPLLVRPEGLGVCALDCLFRLAPAAPERS